MLIIYLVIAFFTFLAVAWDDCSHDSPFRTRWNAVKTGVWVGILWGPLLLLCVGYYLFSLIVERCTR